MTDAELLIRFSTDADMPALWHWRGWPQWNKGSHGTSWNLAWHSHLGNGEWSVGYGTEPNRYHDHYATDYEAACIVRDFLIFQDEMPSFLTGSRFMMNTKIVAAVEAQMAEEEKEKP